MTTPITSQYFSMDEEGNYFGYHVQGGELFDKQIGVSIEKGLFDNTRPFYLCNNYHEWFPMHLKDRDTYQIFRITFNPQKELIFENCSEYNELVKVTAVNIGGVEDYNHTFTTDAMEKVEAGFGLFILPKDNNEKELSEAILVNPKLHILKVELLGSSELIINDQMTEATVDPAVAEEAQAEKEDAEMLSAVEEAEAAM